MYFSDKMNILHLSLINMKKTNTISLITLLMILAGCGQSQVKDSDFITVDVLQTPSSKKELIRPTLSTL